MKNRFLSALALALTVCSCHSVPSFAAQFTVADNYAPLRYTATASQTTFTVTWPFEAEEDLVVKVDAGATGTFATKTLTTDYTTTGESTTNGGTVVFGTGLSAGDIVVITRDSGVTDGTDFGASVTTSALNLRFDQQALALQEVESDVQKRALLLPETEPFSTVSGAIPSASSSAGKLLGYKSDGSGFEAVSSSLNGSSPTTVNGGTFASQGTPIVLRNGSTATREAVTLDTAECSVDTTIDHLFCGDGSTAGGLDFTPLTEADGVFNVAAFGGVPDDSSSDDAAFVAALAAVKAAAGTLVIPSGTWEISTSIDLTGTNGLRLVGLGLAIIESDDLTQPIIILGTRDRVENLILRYATAPGASDLRAVGIQLGKRDSAADPAAHSVVENVAIYRTFVGIQAGANVPAGEADTLFGGGFSNSYMNVTIRDYYYSAIVLNRASSGGLAGGNNTGDFWANTYIVSKEYDSETRVNPAGDVIYLRQHIGSVFNQLNIEGGPGDNTVTLGSPSFAGSLINFGAGSGELNSLTINSFHLEDCYTTEADGALFRPVDNAVLTINGWTMQDCDFPMGGGNAYNIVKFGGDNSTVTINGFGLLENSVASGTLRWVATNGSQDGNSLYVHGYRPVSGQTAIVTHDISGVTTSDGIPIVKQINDLVYSRDFDGVGRFTLESGGSKTLATDALTIAANESYVNLAGESSSDDSLDEIIVTGGATEGQLLVLRQAPTSDDVLSVRSRQTPSEGGDEIHLDGDVPFVFSGNTGTGAGTGARLVLQYQSSNGRWSEVARSQTDSQYRRIVLTKGADLAGATTIGPPTAARHVLTASASNVDVGTITAPTLGPDGFFLALHCSDCDATHALTIKDGTGNVQAAADCALNGTADAWGGFYNSTASTWLTAFCVDAN